MVEVTQMNLKFACKLFGACVLVSKFDPFINDYREFDIITKKCIIEVKGDKVKRCLNQFLKQKRYAEYKNKQHIVFAPTIRTMTKIDYEKHGIKIVEDYKSLISIIKEYE